MSTEQVAEPLPKTLRGRFPIFCAICGERIIGNDYRVTGMVMGQDGIPRSVYSHTDCLAQNAPEIAEH
jgi:hypothetical protein